MEAAERQWPAFERRLAELGYPPAGIHRAFAVLSGPGTVAEALGALQSNVFCKEWVALPFEVCDDRDGYSHGDGFTVTRVDRNEFGLRVEYEHHLALPLGVETALSSHRPGGGARDDVGNEYEAGASHVGLLQDSGKTRSSDASRRIFGGFALAVPAPEATMLRIRVGWMAESPLRWEGPARECRVPLAD